MNRSHLIFLVCLILIFPGIVCADGGQYPDGIYRGFYYDGGIEQLSVQFELKDGLFTSVVYRGVRYKDGDYMSRDASDAQKATLNQYYQLADYLVGKGVSAIDDLYSPYEFVDNIDSVTSATIQSSKLISAIWDALNRHPYKMIDTTKLQTAEAFADGVYRGRYAEHGGVHVEMEFEITDNTFRDASLTLVEYDGGDDPSGVGKAVRQQFNRLANHLIGKPVMAVNDLYYPENILEAVDGVSSATLPAAAVISAVWDGLGRHAYRIFH